MNHHHRHAPAQDIYAVDDLEHAVYYHDPKAGRVDVITGAVLGSAGALLLTSPAMRKLAGMALGLGSRAVVLALAYESAKALGRKLAKESA